MKPDLSGIEGPIIELGTAIRALAHMGESMRADGHQMILYFMINLMTPIRDQLRAEFDAMIANDNLRLVED